ncbi:MAG: RsmE family RNA methyltransferase [Kiritimatiellia bacterium]
MVETARLGEENPALPPEAARHLRVLRPESGEEIELFDGCGAVRRYRWTAGRLAAASAVRAFGRPAQSLTLFACLTKGSRWDWTVEKATELGVTRIVPVISDRTIVRIPSAERAAKRARWQRVAEDAARQSDAKWLPEICAATGFREVLPLVQATTCFIGALTDPPSPPLAGAVRAALAAARNPDDDLRFAVFVGPEGDLTPDELSALTAVARPTSFGPTVLRAETAAIFAVSVLSAAIGAGCGPVGCSAG